jgi:asparagine synthetase B (glutamine-hydrolysing)
MYVPSSRPLDDVDVWVDRLDGPVDTVSVPELAENYQRAHELGAQVVLSGEMAELVFTMGQHLRGHQALHGRWRPLTQWMREQRAVGASWPRILRYVAPSITPAPLATLYLRVRRQRSAWLPGWVDRGPTVVNPRRADLARPARRRWLETQLDPIRAPASITMDADEICAAYCGVEVRRPFADVDLWEFVLSLPAEAKFPDSLPKRILREAMRGRVPDAILDRRRKTVFNQHALATADYDGLTKWILRTDHRVPGVNYGVLASKIEQRSLPLPELMWAYDLARVHAFVSVLG